MSDATLRAKAPIYVILGLLVVALVGLQLTDSEPGLLYLAPALLLLAPLAFDRYPGERLLAAVARARRPVPRRQGRAPARALVSPCCFPRGGALLSMALAGRGPPA